MSFGVVIIGLGQIGMTSDIGLDPEQYIWSHARAFFAHPAFSLLAGVDPSPTSRAAFEEAYRRPSYATAAEALSAHRPDIVVIAVPTVNHLQALQETLAASRPMAVLCEKPLSYRFDEAVAMTDTCRQANVRLFVNYVRRADPAVREIKQRLNSGQIAQPLKGVVWYSKGLFNNGSHFFDLMQYWLGEMRTYEIVNSGRLLGNDPEPDFMAVFGGGQIQFLSAREEDYSHYTIELVSPSGRLRYDQGGSKVVWQSAIASPESPAYKVLDSAEDEIRNDLNRAQWNIADQMANALCGNKSDICSGDEALSTIQHLTSIKDAL
ncbi:Gfo/Idh/MocA family protein [Propionivibrio dicarboxylicus]|uniref:Predicted dehydrogenase n=1 Tax=Propionivibrio dicarboxylicus TaxID=83767 RepID=A0A1G8DXD9_9RHOO|nr:Gfo/Idh/MocA family oxidoreductase [Propionivibrio dicarboxylicus]SDH62333.1 Predicted dehydrogenase [Propionivibrio dicarboxylicus]